MLKSLITVMMVFGSGFSFADCHTFTDQEGNESISRAELCYASGDKKLISFQITYPDGRQTNKVTDFEMRIEGSEQAGTLLHGIDSFEYWFMVEWHSDSLTVFDERAREGSFLDLVDPS